MKLRRIIVFLVTFVTLFAFSCGSVFARNNADFEITLPLANNVTGIIGTLNTSALDEAGFKFMQDYANGVGNYFVAYGGVIEFARLPSNFTKSNISYSSEFDSFIFNIPFEVITFNLTTGNPTNFHKGSFINKTVVNSRRDRFVDYQCLVDLGVSKSSIPFIWKPLKNVGFTFLFDKSLVDEPEPPVSSAPTSSAPTSSQPVSSQPTSSAPTSSQPVSSQPTSSTPTSSEPVSSKPTSSEPTKPPPINEEYLGISQTVVTDIFSYFRSVIGTSTNTGIMVFIFIVGIFITVSIFRYFFD